MRTGKKLMGVVGALLLCAAPVFADVSTLSFEFSDLDGDFSSGASTFTANNRTSTDGDVTRLIGGATHSEFDFAALGIGSSAFNITMSVSGITTTTASGTGTLTITDVDGDKFTTDVDGTWIKAGSSGNFIGLLSNFLPDDSAGDGSFEGNTSGSFSMDFSPTTPPFAGNVISLVFGGWFSNGAGVATSFTDKNTHVQGEVAAVPTPGAALLGLMGLGLVGRMKRKVT